MSVVVLKLDINGLQSGEGLALNTKASLKSWHKQNKSKKVQLILNSDGITQHKIYIDKKYDPKRLTTLLLRELDQYPILKLNEIYYDYVEINSSIPELAAYQFVYIKKIQIAKYLKLLKQADINIIKIELAQNPEFNLLPWRERLRQKQFYKRIIALGLLPTAVLIILLALNSYFNEQNTLLNNKIKFLNQQNLHQQEQQAFTLQQIQPLFLLIKNLTAIATLHQASYSKGCWQLNGSLEDINNLAVLNAQLIHEGWLKAGESVNLHEQDHQYLWQITTAGFRP